MSNINWTGVWSGSVSYNAGDAVSYLGSSYVAASTSTNILPSNNTATWNLLASAGAVGPTGPAGINGQLGFGTPRGLYWRGSYAALTAYNLYDLVTFAGNSYICLGNGVLNLGPDTNPAYWGVICEGGPTGATGPQGVAGATGPTGPAGSQVQPITFGIDGGGSVITTGNKGFVYIPYACTITASTLVADQSGSAVIDIWMTPYASYQPGTHPVIGDSITGSAQPTLSSNYKSTDTTLAGWTTSIPAGSVLQLNVTSVATITHLVASLTVVKN